MDTNLPIFWHAVRHFWLKRQGQMDEQVARGTSDQGTRGAVTGGGHLDGFLLTLSEALTARGAPEGSVITRRGQTVLPGFFRPAKRWDLLVVVDNRVLAAVELKSQVGSIGNNANNRAEESIGNAVDQRTAWRRSDEADTPEPWLGYLFLLEDSPAVHTPVRVPEPWLPLRDELRGLSYAERYGALCRRLQTEDGLYNAASVLLSLEAAASAVPNYSEPVADCSGDRFVASLTDHVAAAL